MESDICVWGYVGFQEFLWKGACSLPHTPTLFWPSCGIKAFWHPIHQEQELRYEFHVQSSSWSVGRAEKHNRLWRESIEWSRSYRIQFAPSDQISMSKIEVELSIFLKELWTCWYNFQKLAKGRVFSFLKWYEKSNLILLTIIQNDLMSLISYLYLQIFFVLPYKHNLKILITRVCSAYL